MYTKRFFSVFILTACVSLLYHLNLLHENEKMFLCRAVPEGYEAVLFGKGNKAVFSMVYPEEPGIVKIAEEILEISVSTGNPSRYVFYFDRQRSIMSETFFNPILFDNKYVAYMKDDRLILADIFREGILELEIVRDFSEMADPVSAIISVEMLEGGEILLQYYQGEDMEIMSEMIEPMETAHVKQDEIALCPFGRLGRKL